MNLRIQYNNMQTIELKDEMNQIPNSIESTNRIKLEVITSRVNLSDNFL